MSRLCDLFHAWQSSDKAVQADSVRYRQFLDSSGNALTIIHCFTDIPKGGGGTALCEDGIKGE